jgi:hypothetical protein
MMYEEAHQYRRNLRGKQADMDEDAGRGREAGRRRRAGGRRRS